MSQSPPAAALVVRVGAVRKAADKRQSWHASRDASPAAEIRPQPDADTTGQQPPSPKAKPKPKQRLSWHQSTGGSDGDLSYLQSFPAESDGVATRVSGGRASRSGSHCDLKSAGTGFTIGSWAERPHVDMETSDGRKSAPRNGETSQLTTVSASIIPSDSLLVDKELPLGSRIIFSLCDNYIDVVVRELRGGHFLSFPPDPALHLHIVAD